MIAALTANAIKPTTNQRAGIPAFFAGWLFGETAPHMLALTAADAALHLTRSRRTGVKAKLALGLAGLSAAGLARMIRQSQQVEGVIEDALVDGLGVDYAEQFDEVPAPGDLPSALRSSVRPFNFNTTGMRVERNISYSESGKRGLLDIYVPENAPPNAPVLLQVHGGAWTVGQKDQQGLPLMTHMASRGWICVAINYRLSPRATWPDHVIDVKRAIAWVKENIGEYGGNPDYVVITGGSAGGHLTALAALTPNDPAFQPGFEGADTTVQAAVPFYGVYDWAGSTGLKTAIGMRDTFLAPRVAKSTWDEAPDVFEAASPILRITPDAPDFFVLHGELDTLVDVNQARLFVEKLKSVSKKSVVYAELPGAQHAFEVFHSIRTTHTVRAVDRYLNWHWNTWRAGVEADSGVDPEELEVG